MIPSTVSAVPTVISAQDRARQIQKELALLKKAAAILQAEFGANPLEPREMGYALTKGVKELSRELAASGFGPEARYNPFWADCRRR